jgi:hypothetical protein
MNSVTVPFGIPTFLPLSWPTLLMSDSFRTTMWLVPQKIEFTATAGHALVEPDHERVVAVEFTSMAPAIIASRPSCRGEPAPVDLEPFLLEVALRIAITSGTPIGWCERPTGS